MQAVFGQTKQRVLFPSIWVLPFRYLCRQRLSNLGALVIERIHDQAAFVIADKLAALNARLPFASRAYTLFKHSLSG